MSEKIKKTFTEIKQLSESKKLNMQYIDGGRSYYIFVTDSLGTIYQNIIYKSSFLEDHNIIGVDKVQNASDEIDFVDNYKNICDQNISDNKPKTEDNRDYLYTTARPIGTAGYFTGEGDDISSYNKIGGGTLIELNHTVGEPLTNSLYIDFNVIDNTTYIHEGYLTFNCNSVRLSFLIVPRLTTFVPASNTYFNLVNNYLIVPAAGNGNIQLTEAPNLVAVSLDNNGKQYPAFWDAEFNYTTGVFENLRPNPTGAGGWNIFGNEIILYRMFQRIKLTGEATLKQMGTNEQGKILPGFRFKTIIEVIPPDHNASLSALLVLYRQKAGMATR